MRIPHLRELQGLAILLLLPLAALAQPPEHEAATASPLVPLDREDTTRSDTTPSDTTPSDTTPSDASRTDSTAGTSSPIAATGIATSDDVAIADMATADTASGITGPYRFGMVQDTDTPDESTPIGSSSYAPSILLEYRDLAYREPDAVELPPLFIDSALSSAHLAAAETYMQSGELDLARAHFDSTLDADPMNARAFSGLGYLRAWAGEHDAAEDAFHRALTSDPYSLDAAKGLAYVAHWRGRNEEAAARFGALAAAYPGETELALMHARALQASKRSMEARTIYSRLLRADSTNFEARKGFLSTRMLSPKVEMTSWLGVTWFDDEERPKAEANLGFRFIEVAIWPMPNARLWFQYDNGLSLDNVVLSAGNRTVPAGYIGGFINHDRRHTTRAEIGWRSLPGSVGQVLLRSEHVVSLDRGYAIKGGLWLGLRSDDRTEWIGHGGLTIPIGDRFELSPTFFYASNGMPNEHEWRVLLSGEYRFENGWQVSGGYAGGQASTGYLYDYRTIWDRYLKISAPVSPLNRAHALLRTEMVGETDATTIFSVGLTIGLSER